MSDIAKDIFKSVMTDTATADTFSAAMKNKIDTALDVRKVGIAANIYNKQVPSSETVVEQSVDLEEAFVIDKGAKVAMKLKNGKMLYGKVLNQQKVMGKAGVEVKWSDGTKGRFPTDEFSALSMDSKADYKLQ